MTILAAAVNDPPGGDAQLIVAGVAGIAVVVLLITWLKVHPFLALILGSLVLGVVAGLGFDATIAAFTKGVGDTTGSVGVLVALGAMIGGLLTDSGGAGRIVDAVVDNVSEHRLPWAMAGLAALIGLPLFFEIGVVLLVPVVVLVARRTGASLLVVGIPALAGLSVLHGLVPPHPGPLLAISSVHADLGVTLGFGLLVAVPTVIVAGPVFGSLIARYVHVETPAAVGGVRAPSEREPAAVGAGRAGGTVTARDRATGSAGPSDPEDDRRRRPDEADLTGAGRRLPGVVPTVATILVPIVLMLAGAVGKLVLDDGTGTRKVLDVLGTPVLALLAGVVIAMFTLGIATGMDRTAISGSLSGALPGIAGILLIVAAGGGFKQEILSAGIGDMVGNAAKDANISVLVLGWLVAVGIRVATGSATVATTTAAGIVAPLADGLPGNEVALLALAIGAGSLFFSHVNDAGFWLVKEYFGMTVSQTLKTWSAMETIISVVAIALILALNVVV